MQSTVTDLIGWTCNIYITIFHFDLHITIDVLLQFAFWTFYSNYIIITNGNGNSIWKCNWCFTYTRHVLKILSLEFQFRVSNRSAYRIVGLMSVSYTHLTLPTSDLV